MDIKLLALDVDGTVTENCGTTVPLRNREAVYAAQAQGVFVTLATGRSCVASKGFWQQLRIQGPSIHFGGAWTVDTRDGRVLDERLIDPDLANEILRFAFDNGFQAHIYEGDTVIADRDNDGYLRFIRNNNLPYLIDPDMLEKRYEHVQKILVFVDPAQEPTVRGLFADRFGEQVHITRSQPSFIEINALGVNKGTALARLAKRMGLKREQVAAVGDSYLDLDMIRWAGVGVCVADGVPEVKAAADLIVPACMDCGVADFIENNILLKR